MLLVREKVATEVYCNRPLDNVHPLKVPLLQNGDIWFHSQGSRKGAVAYQSGSENYIFISQSTHSSDTIIDSVLKASFGSTNSSMQAKYGFIRI